MEFRNYKDTFFTEVNRFPPFRIAVHPNTVLRVRFVPFVFVSLVLGVFLLVVLVSMGLLSFSFSSLIFTEVFSVFGSTMMMTDCDDCGIVLLLRRLLVSIVGGRGLIGIDSTASVAEVVLSVPFAGVVKYEEIHPLFDEVDIVADDNKVVLLFLVVLLDVSIVLDNEGVTVKVLLSGLTVDNASFCGAVVVVDSIAFVLLLFVAVDAFPNIFIILPPRG